MGQVINIRNTHCPLCPEITPVTNIEADLAFICLANEIFEKAIASQNYEMAMKVADQLLISANTIGQYAIHQTHL
jgi:hypothetical protein